MAGIVVKFDKARMCPFALAEGTVRAQALIPVPNQMLEGLSVEDVAEAVFEATNAPFELKDGSLSQRVRDWFRIRSGYPSLSVGDVVALRCAGDKDASVRVEAVGFSRVGA